MGSGHPTKKGHVHTHMDKHRRKYEKQITRKHTVTFVKRLMSNGLSLKEACDEAGISPGTYRYLVQTSK